MNLDDIWTPFLNELAKSDAVSSVSKKKITGIPFLYFTVNKNIGKERIETLIKVEAAKVMKGKRLRMEYSFVREDQSLMVYRVRFLVPQEKMFCCGNLCPDCIRFRE
ncbi:hypothetical protein [Pseudalkalibacillus hwajinpoensis]|uniref:Uncharacterized protein n=1 Tax=Guptibacillus hwajinpoensis TaxID=208199 RepID=A0A4U1MMA6_9BACL|nr:hypothetical protein [Pseudalkalibacillus hwajinpoensis]TKD71775.1 hypothetical protein FBF83_02940 [Pseudalkalibacillus hwajinpoensis]